MALIIYQIDNSDCAFFAIEGQREVYKMKERERKRKREIERDRESESDSESDRDI